MTTSDDWDVEEEPAVLPATPKASYTLRGRVTTSAVPRREARMGDLIKRIGITVGAAFLFAFIGIVIAVDMGVHDKWKDRSEEKE